MLLFLLRGVFIVLVAGVAMLYILPFQEEANIDFESVLLMVGVGLGVSFVAIVLDAVFGRKKLSAMSGVFLGLVAGLVMAYALSFVVDLYGLITVPQVRLSRPNISQVDLLRLERSDPELKARYDEQIKIYENQVSKRDAYLELLQGVKVVIGLITCYFGISLVLQTKGDFRFVIPYVEFAKQIRGNRPTLLDTSVIIDGRILDLAGTHVLQGSLLVPKFVLEELQLIADSADKLKRARGRRGLDVLQQLQVHPNLEVSIDESQIDAATVDQKLVVLAEQTRARIMTNDFNLGKVAKVRGVDVINLNEMAKALKPVVLPGEPMRVRVIKTGEGVNQGVGYLDDGTMVVVENGKDHIGDLVSMTVTSSLQTSAGRMIFGRFDAVEDGASNEDTVGHDQSEAETSTATNTQINGGSGHIPTRPSRRNPRRNRA